MSFFFFTPENIQEVGPASVIIILDIKKKWPQKTIYISLEIFRLSHGSLSEKFCLMRSDSLAQLSEV